MHDTLPLYISPCPNDTFITYAMNIGIVSASCSFDVHFSDVQELNENVLQGLPCISKISTAVLSAIKEDYTLLRTGAAMGLGCGPILVAREKTYLESGTIAIPGIYTTANALLTLHGVYKGKRIPMLFSDILHAVQAGCVDIGVLIHESRFEYERHGLIAIEDLGDFWEERYAMPLPLGVFVIHNSLLEYKEHVENVMRQSLEYSYTHYDDALAYCATYAQEMDKKILEEHIKTFVNSYSLDMKREGEEAIKTLLDALQCN